MAGKTNDTNILHILLNIYENKQDASKQKALLLRLSTLAPKDSQVKVKLANIYLLEQKLDQA